MSKDNPCTGVCEFAGRTGWCVACGRTLGEARDWKKLTPFRRKVLLRELPRRLTKLEGPAGSSGA